MTAHPFGALPHGAPEATGGGSVPADPHAPAPAGRTSFAPSPGAKIRSAVDGAKEPPSSTGQPPVDGGSPLLTIGEVSRLTGATLRALRFYGEKGLLKPVRRGTTRLYAQPDVERVRAIRLMVDAGIELRWVAQILQKLDNEASIIAHGILQREIAKAETDFQARGKAIDMLFCSPLYREGRLS